MGDGGWEARAEELLVKGSGADDGGRIGNYFTPAVNQVLQIMRGQMQKILSFRDLQVWQLSMDLVVAVTKPPKHCLTASNTGSLHRCAAPLFRFRQTSPKVMPGAVTVRT